MILRAGRRADRLPPHAAGHLRRGALHRAGSDVRPRGSLEPGVLVRVRAHGARGHGVRASRERRRAARGGADLRGQRARGHVRGRLPVALPVLGADGGIGGAAGMAAPRTAPRWPPDSAICSFTCSAGCACSGGSCSHWSQTGSLAFGDMSASCGDCRVHADPRRLPPQCGGAALGRLASGRLPGGHGHGRSLSDGVHHEVGGLCP